MNELSLTILAARQADQNVQIALEKRRAMKRTLGAEIKRLRTSRGMTQAECKEWVERNGLKTSINRAEVPSPRACHRITIEAQIKIIDLLR